MSVVSAELIHRRAWPSFHHFSLSRTPRALELLALVENTGNVALVVQALFTVAQPDGSVVQVASPPQAFVPGEEQRVGTSFSPPSMLGVHHVTAQVLFGLASPNMVSPDTKEFKFDVVP